MLLYIIYFLPCFISGLEESIARSSSLYSTVSQDKFLSSFYAFNKRDKLCLYSHRIIYSPLVVIFKDDAGHLLSDPYCANIVTSPAPNAGIVSKRHKDAPRMISETLIERIRRILYIFHANGDDTLVLGAFGCGVFRNNPIEVASVFKQELDSDKFKFSFRKVVFAILDPQMASIFQQVFSGVSITSLQTQFGALSTSENDGSRKKREGHDKRNNHRQQKK
jgi:uncharacterized protein (TIGR02452 family)